MNYTAERVNENTQWNTPVFNRQLFAYEESVKYIKGDVLEIGCGEGYGAKLLSPYSRSYTGIDKFETANKHNLKNVNFLKMNVPTIKGLESNSFDLVISFQVIEHIQNDALFIEEIHRLLKTNGTLIFTTPNLKMSLTRNPFHIKEYVLEEFEGLMSKFSSYKLLGTYGNEKVMDYYEKNKASVEKITRFDIFNFQYNLPRVLLQTPYNIANFINRKMLIRKNTELTTSIQTSDYSLKPADDTCLDFFCIATK